LHWPYWYVGIFGWHYVFEAAPVWCLVVALALRAAGQAWWLARRDLLFVWTAGLIGLAWAGCDFASDENGATRLQQGIGVIRHPRRQQGAFQAWIAQTVTPPALVLVDQPHDGPQVDYVVNHAGLTAPVLLGRYRAGITDPVTMAHDFPRQQVYVANPERGT